MTRNCARRPGGSPPLSSPSQEVTSDRRGSPAYPALYPGSSPSSRRGERHGAALPDGSAYFCSRGSLLGQVPGDVVASAFAVFNPSVVVPAVTSGWSITDAAAIEQARTGGAIAQLTRILGPSLRHRARPGRPRPGQRLAAGRGKASLRRRPRAAGAVLAAGRGLALCRPAARVPRRRAYRRVDVGRLRCRRDRPADRAVLGIAPEDVHPVPGLRRRRNSMTASGGSGNGTSSGTAR